MVFGPVRGLLRMDTLQEELDSYPYLHASRANLLLRLGRRDEARAAYTRALELTGNSSERCFIEERLDEIRAD